MLPWSVLRRSALLRGSPFAWCGGAPMSAHSPVLQTAQGFWGISTDKSHVLDFFGFLGTFRGRMRSSRDSTLGAHMLRSCSCTSHPPVTTAMPFISSAFVLLNEASCEPHKSELAWVGGGLRFGFCCS